MEANTWEFGVIVAPACDRESHDIWSTATRTFGFPVTVDEGRILVFFGDQSDNMNR